jgi:hypothetical protein
MDQTGIRERVQEFIGSMAPTGQSCRVGLVHPDQIPEIWHKVEHHIERSSLHSEGELTTSDFYLALIEEEMQLWVAVEDGDDVIATLITQIVPYPQKKVLRLISVGGKNMDRWLHFMKDIEEFARLTHCNSMEVWGRKGWKKILTDWKDSYVVYTKELDRRLH